MSDEIPHRSIIVLCIMLATIMPILDTTIANVALPHMQGSFAATQSQIAWVLTSYIVASAIMTPITGWLAGRLGARRLFCVSIIGFTVTSGLCGIAVTLEQIIFFRILQGITGAALVPLSQSVLLDVTPKEKHGRVMALWSMGVVMAPILGPTLGGYLSEVYSWRWVFYINLPIGILTFVGLVTYLPDTERHERVLDMFGFAALAIAIGSLQLMLDRGQQADWFASKEIILYAGLTAGGMWMFITHVINAKHPFITLSLFQDRNFVTCLCFSFFVGLVLMATIMLLAPYMQILMGYPVITVGELLAPRGIGVMISSLFIGRMIGKVDSRALIFVGLGLTAYSLWEMTQFTTFVPQSLIIRAGIVQGLGIGMIFVPLNTLAYATLAPRLRTEATSFYNLMRNLGQSIGISVVVALLGRSIQINHSYLAERITPYKTGFVTNYLPPPFNHSSAAVLSVIDAEINRQAATIAYINDFYFMMIVVLVCMPFVMLLRKPETFQDVKKPTANAAQPAEVEPIP